MFIVALFMVAKSIATYILIICKRKSCGIAIQKWSIDLCYNMDELWRHAKWKESVQKAWYDSMECLKFTEIESELMIT